MFSFEFLTGGSFQYGGRVQGARTLLVASLVLAASVQAQEFVSARVSGKVADTAGVPVVGARVFVNRTTGARMDMEGVFERITDKDGRYEITLRFEKGKRLMVPEVFAEGKRYARSVANEAFPLAEGDVKTLDFTLAKGEVIAGTLRLPPGELRTNVQHVLMVSGPTIDHMVDNARAYLTASNGTFEVYLPAGEYTFAVLTTAEKIERSGIKTGQRDVVLDAPLFEWSEATVGGVFDRFCEMMNANYSYFFLKTNVDWGALKEQFRLKAIRSNNAKELADVLSQMLAPLQDIHIWIQTPGGRVPTHRGSYSYNGNLKVTLGQLDDQTECGHFAVVGKARADGFGYFLMLNQSAATPEDVKKAAAAIQKLSSAPGFVVDLRRANGGSEPLANEIARLFCGRDTVYAKHKYRNGPGHEDFGKEDERILPGVALAYTNPVVCLIGPGAVSSGEAFVKMMKCLPHVTTVGQRTRGASGNPKPWPLAQTQLTIWGQSRQTGVTVYFSRWVDLMPDGRTFEGVGIPPDVEVNDPVAAYANADPPLQKGLEILRERTQAKQRAVRD